ncbi:hypothetical protein FISHEDRAFT_70162 [Fistulina hepatica ATCC 64428]|uniref:Uncharacterized protein n=1 Tax=Fistulina hepatica ATCC 64428 TaxID=1128425 RepID=A0A0D7ALP4_9AGAR|nr:hypothetical protein FISHEDRAFT_70162 [Fistulina hepatica ATCC 64428]
MASPQFLWHGLGLEVRSSFKLQRSLEVGKALEALFGGPHLWPAVDCRPIGGWFLSPHGSDFVFLFGCPRRDLASTLFVFVDPYFAVYKVSAFDEIITHLSCVLILVAVCRFVVRGRRWIPAHT